MKIAKRILSAAVTLILAAVILGNGYLLAARFLFHIEDPSIFGFRFAVVMSGSMEPVLFTGDFVAVKTQDAYETGDIIMFHEEEILVTHRIVGEENGKFITKGDANNAEDQGRVEPAMIRGRMVFAIPHIGLAFIPQTFSRYVSRLTGSVVFEAAAQVNNTSSVSLRRGGAYEVERVPLPGESETILFSVSNYKGISVSEVAQDYQIVVESTGNLPLTYTVKALKNNSPLVDPEKNRMIPGTEDGEGAALFEGPDFVESGVREQVMEGGRMPCAEMAAHSYLLTITCPPKLSYEDNQEIEQITVRFRSQQALEE